MSTWTLNVPNKSLIYCAAALVTSMWILDLKVLLISCILDNVFLDSTTDGTESVQILN